MSLKYTLAMIAVLLVGLIGFCWVYWPDDAYDAGYGPAYEQAWSTWMLTMPPPQACEQVTHDVLAVHGDGNGLIKSDMSPQQRFDVVDRIRHGCQSGFYDGVSYRRNQLGLGPL